jgi:hypothetical protein
MFHTYEQHQLRDHLRATRTWIGQLHEPFEMDGWLATVYRGFKFWDRVSDGFQSHSSLCRTSKQELRTSV